MADIQIPLAAFSAGYRTRTFGPSPVYGIYPGQLQNMTFYGYSTPKTWVTQNCDGSLTIAPVAQGTPGSGSICTASRNTVKPNNWQGIAFGGGAYFEAEFSFNVPSGPIAAAWPAFWANDIETMALNGINAVNQWPGQAANFGDWIEIDVMEYDLGNSATYGCGFHNGYGTIPGAMDCHSLFAANAIGSKPFSEFHKYGFLWIPATPTSVGTGTWFLDGVAMRSVSWNLYSPALAPPPVVGSTAVSILDSRHLAPMITTGVECPLTLRSLSVWQASASSNLVQ